MTLDEFYKRLSVQKNAQSTNLINPDFNTDEMSNTIRNIQANRNMQNSQSNVNKIISNNPNVREVLRVPVSQTINQKLNIDPSKLEHKNTIFEDMGNVGKNLWNGIKSSGYNIANSIPKLFNAIDEGINGGTPEEYYDKIMLKDLKNLGVDGSNMSIDEKANTLKDIWGEAHINKYKTKYKTEEELENAYNKVLSKTDNDIYKMTLLEKENLLKKLSGDEIFNSMGYSKYKGNNDFDALMSEENIEKVDNKLKSIDEDIAKNIENTNNPILKKGAELAPSLASNATTGALSLINPVIGTTAFSASAMNSYARQGKEELGLSDSASVLYGTILSGMESVTEGFELSKFSKATKGLFRAQGKKQIKEAVKDYLMNIGTNYIQEAMMEPIQETTNQLFTGESDWNNMPTRMNQAGINGALSAAILDIGSSTIAGTINVASKLNNKSQENLKSQIIDKINTNELFDKSSKEVFINSLDKLNNKRLYDFNSYLDDTIEIVNKIENVNEKMAPIDNNSLNASAKKDIARRIFLDSAISNNIDVDNNNEVLDSMFEIAYQRGVNISIDGKAFTNQNQDALWRVNKETGQREVIVNPNNPTKALQSLTIHEMTHDMENTLAYGELSKVVLDYAKKQNNYDTAFKELSDMYAEEYKNYKGDEFNSRIEQEMVADILGEKLGNQEFVNSIVTSNRGVAQNIYSWVIDKLNKLNKLTGYKFEKLYWTDVENKFKKAFDSEFDNINGDTKYSIKKDINGNNYVEIEEDILKGVPKKEWVSKVRELFKTKFPDGIDMGFFNVGLNAKSVREFLNSKYTQEIKANQKDIYKAKLKMANNLHEIVQNASNVKNELARHKNYKSYNRGYIGVKIGNDFYNIEILTGINSKNNEMFYDIVNIKKGLLSSSLSTENDSNPITNIIPLNENYVNNDAKNDASLKKLALTSSFFEGKTDNKGRELSTQQQEYFKDSKVRDENGNLLTMYHGTSASFSTFDINKAKSSGTLGKGFYFTNSISHASQYGNNLEVYLNIKNPIISNQYTITEEQLNNFLTEIAQNEDYGIENYGENVTIDEIINDLKGKDDFKILRDINLTCIGDFVETVKLFNKINKTSYDGIITDLETVAFNSNQIKNVNNTNPTNSDDIRYSKSNNGAYQQFLKDNFSNNGTKTYMKDIKKAPIPEDTISKNSAPIPEKVQIKNDADNFAKQVDEYVSGNLKSGSMIRVGKTPQVLKDIGVPNKDIVLKQSKLKTILKEDNNPNSNEHGIPINTIKEIPRALSEPLNILKSSTQKNSIVVVTDLADKLDRPIIVSIELDYEGQIGNIKVLNNRLTSIYGKREYDRFMNDEIEKENLLYDIDEGIIKELPATGLQLSKGISSRASNKAPINNIIPSEQNYVNNDKNGIKNTENAPFNPEFKGKERKRYQTIINSDIVSKEAKAIAKELMGVDIYIPESNVKQLNKADYTIEQLGVDRTLENLKSKLDGGQRILAEDIAIGDRLIQYYSKTGERQKLQDAIQYTAMAGTEAGRTVQAMAMIAHQSPEGQALWIQRSINKLNQKIASKKGAKVEIIDGKQVVTKNGKILEKVQLFEFTSDMQESILSAKSNKELYDILDNIYEELGGQVTKNTFEKLDSWRYFSMLANPTTHVRNIVGNTAMTGTQGVKNKIAGVIEDIVAIFNKDMERTKSLVRRADAETVKFAKDDIKNVADRLGLNQNKYSPTSRIESNKKEFKSDILNKTLGNAYKLNSKLLEVEDGWGLKYNYAKALSSYISSNKIDVNNITDAQLGKARNYAINQAKEATFHQESKLASALNQIGNNNEVAKFVLDSTVPFKAVPINVAKTGLAYSPLQLAKSVTTDLVNLRNGNITVNQYIDNLSKGLTGTGIALIGYVLAGMGILKANGTDDDKEKYDEAQGNQTFSVTIGTQNFSLSWLAPTAIPLFIGAEMNEILNSNKENKGNLEEGEYDKVLNLAKNTVDVFANAMNPMTEMSMLSGLTSTFRSYDQDNYLVGIGTNIAKSYVNQYVPTALGKIARITDEYERDTTSTKSGTIPKAIDSTKNQMMSKVPILRQMLPVKKDTWGKEVKSPTLPVRIFENTLAPYARKEISNDKVDKYLNRLYDKTKSKDLLPDTISKTLIFDGSTYRYTNEEYNKYKAEFGKSAHDKITNVMNNKTFNKLTDDEKVDIINKIYSDCKEEVKEEYAKVHKIEYERSDKNIEVEEEIKKGLDMSNAYIYKTIISKKESDKNEDGNTISSSATKNKLRYIMGMEIDDKQKQHLINISTNDTDYDVSLKDLKKLNEDYLTYLQQSGKKPEKGGLTEREEYMQLINSEIPVKQLNKYYSEKGDIEGVKDSSGKTISGSKKQAIFNYVNSLSLSIPQKQILLARENESFAKLYYNDIINYINNLNISNTEKSKMYDAIFKKIK